MNKMTDALQAQIDATIYLVKDDNSMIDEGRVKARLTRLIETCLAFATQPLEQANRNLIGDYLKYSDHYVDEAAKKRRLEAELAEAQQRIKELEAAWHDEQGKR